MNHYVVLDEHRRVLGHHDVKRHGEYKNSLQHLLDEHPDSFVEEHENAPVARIGSVLDPDGQTATAHPIDMPLKSVTQRWDDIVRFALVERSMGFHSENHPTRSIRLASVVYSHFLYNLLLTAHNIENRKSSTHWEKIEESMIGFLEFAKMVSPANIQNLQSEGLNFYSHDNVFLYEPSSPRDLVKARSKEDRIEGTDDTPVYGLDSSHYIVREILGIPPPYEVHIANLLGFTLTDNEGNPIQFSPDFDSNILSYTAEIDDSVSAIVIQTTLEYRFATVQVVSPDTLQTGSNVYRINVQSQDKQVTKTYLLIVEKGA